MCSHTDSKNLKTILIQKKNSCKYKRLEYKVSTDQITQVVKRLLLVQEVWGLNPESIKSVTCCKRLATVATLMCGPKCKAVEISTAYSWHPVRVSPSIIKIWFGGVSSLLKSVGLYFAIKFFQHELVHKSQHRVYYRSLWWWSTPVFRRPAYKVRNVHHFPRSSYVSGKALFQIRIGTCKYIGGI